LLSNKLLMPELYWKNRVKSMELMAGLIAETNEIM
jgi:hypothetical protein